MGGSQGDDFDSPPRPAKRRKTTTAADKTKKQPVTRKTTTTKKTQGKKKSTDQDPIVDDGEEDAFDPPAPVVKPKRKPRKKVQNIVDDDAIGDSDEKSDRSAAKTRRKTPKRTSVDPDADDFEQDDDGFTKPKKPKHRIHTPVVQDYLPEAFLDQEPPESSAPWSLRGPIWRKDVLTAQPQVQQRVQMVPKSMGAVERSPDKPSLASKFAYTASSTKNGASLIPPVPAPANVSGPAVRDVSPSPPPSPKPLPKASELWETGGSSEDIDPDDLMLLETDAVPTRKATPEILSAPMSRPEQRSPRPQIPDQTFDIDDELADLPSDAFDDSDGPSPAKASEGPIHIPSQPQAKPVQKPNLAPPKSGLRQMTLFGGTVQPMGPASQANKKHAWPLATQKEPATHHKLDEEAIKTWVYPTNLGTIRDYQYNIVARGLFHNLLVALPTGLGKTFIAATIMLNWFRWTQSAQIVFVAPTKPLVAQQIDACFQIVGIPRSQTAMLTGATAPGLRAEEWNTKRVFFMTPQTIINDLKRGLCDPKRIVLVVVDEAHRATGGYAYVEVIKFLRRFNQSFRVLALTATPGATVDAVQQVIDGLDISRVEIRTENSLDIRQYVHSRDIDSIKFDYSEEMQTIMELATNAIRPVLNKLASQNAYWNRDPMKLTAYSCTQAQRQWFASDAGKKAPQSIKGMVISIFRVLASLGHSISLLKFHGIGPFYKGMVNFRNSVDGGEIKGKYGTQIRDDENFVKMMNMMQTWTRNPDFLGHPKLEYLRQVVLNHFLDAGEGTARPGVAASSTRIMVFAHWRESAEEIVRVLKRNEPMIRPHVFVGQADSKGSEGMGQKRQLEVIQEFKDGKYNTLVATSIGEEGLDIGEVDLIVCYDASSSPIRMLQRMGRTGRKRKGNIVLLLMRDKEESDFEKAKDNYEKMQGMIATGDRFTFHDDRSPRIVPKEVQPVVDKRIVEIPVENSQAELPEPKKRKRVPKLPPKKFHMPDNVKTGFVRASRMDEGDDDDNDVEAAEDVAPRSKAKSKKPAAARKKKGPTPEPEAAPLPFLSDVYLNRVQERELERKYQYVQETDDGVPTVAAPRLDKFTTSFPGPTKYVKHGQNVSDIATMMHRIHTTDESTIQKFKDNLHMSDLEDDVSELLGGSTAAEIQETAATELPAKKSAKAKKTTAKSKASKAPRSPKAAKTPKPRGRPRKQQQQQQRKDSSDMEAASSSPEPTPANMRMPTQGIDLGSDDTVMGEGDAGESEHDSELADFVVGSDAPIEFVSSSLPPTQYGGREERRGSIGSSDEEGGGVSDGSVVALNREDVGDEDVRVRKPGRRRQVVDDDSDE